MLPKVSDPILDFLTCRYVQDRQDRASNSDEPAPFVGADVWLLASTLQKAIRRGDLSVARRAGYQLLSLDRRRLWRRVAIVALEDIGVANIDAAITMIAVATSMKRRKAIGGELLALEFVLAEACKAAKDRSGDHLISVITHEPVSAPERVILQGASRSALLARMVTSSVPLVSRIRAALVADERHALDRSRPGGDAVIGDVFEVLEELAVPSFLLSACKAYARQESDPLPVIVPMLWLERRVLVDTLGEIRRVTPPVDLIDELPDYAFDPIHTRLGKRAVELWLRCYLSKPSWSARQVAMALWHHEAAACDQTLAWAEGENLRIRAERADLLSCGVPDEQHDAIKTFVIEQHPALTCARRAVWANAKQTKLANSVLEQENLPLPVPTPRKCDG